ncbi:DUF3108 domain-containing protein [Chitinilyticum aquatile]|uniref:DUF3108 domain-containing protein n=1 Tax=Chitinilyticum aquatile TaxID=362520 RepID=UPI00048CF334|nr:DUF3108 domain-containing protein [Chitinilyticum aquatile]
MSKCQTCLLFVLLVLSGIGASAAGKKPVQAFPARVEIVYRYGAMPVNMQWQTGRDAYQLDVVLQILHKTIAYRSEGRLEGKAVIPLRFGEYRDRKPEPRYQADFNWQDGVVLLGKPGEQQPAPLEAGDQDLFSAAFQLALNGGRAQTMTLLTGRKRYPGAVFVAQEKSTLRLGSKDVEVLLLHGELADRTVDYWLAPQWHNLPVRMTVNLPGDGSFDLWASEIRLDGRTVLQPAAAGQP